MRRPAPLASDAFTARCVVQLRRKHVTMRGLAPAAIGLLACAALIVIGCDREKRAFRVPPPSAVAPQTTQPGNVDVRAGGDGPDPSWGGGPSSAWQAESEPTGPRNQGNAYAMAQGQTLYSMMNCNGCHANGGGGIGPPLIDGKWIYGSEPAQVYDTIVSGRPGGMPSFRGRLPDAQMWQLVVYVRSMSGLASKVAAPGRMDHMQNTPPPNSTPRPKTLTSMPSAPPTTNEAPPTTRSTTQQAATSPTRPTTLTSEGRMR